MLRHALPFAVLAAAILATGLAAPAHALGERPASAEARAAKGVAGLSPRFVFTGVRTSDSVATTVHCTNFASTATNVEVILFDFLGGTSYTTSALPIAAGRTMTVSFDSDDGNAAFYTDDALVVTAVIDQGRGEIRLGPDAAGVACTAQVLDSDLSPPSFVITLPMFLVGRDGLPLFDDGFEALTP